MKRWLVVASAVALLVAACAESDDGASSEVEMGEAVDAPPSTSATGVAAGTSATRPLRLTDPASTPPVDRSRASVSLDEIVFDTFDGGSVPLSQADDALVDRLFDAIVPIDAPDYESAGEVGAWLGDDELVLGYVDDDGWAWAYPFGILQFHEIVNDELAGRPVLVSYCPLCGSGVVYDRRVDGRELSFSNTSALHENDLVMVDRETGSYWWQVAGRAIVGESTGAELDPLPSVVATWASWQQAHPSTSVLARPFTGRRYSDDLFSTYPERVDEGRTPFPVSDDAIEDGRLAASAIVVVVHVGGSTYAWPVDPAGTTNDAVGDLAVEVVSDGDGATVRESATGDELATRTSMWFAVVAAFPDVELRSRTS